MTHLTDTDILRIADRIGLYRDRQMVDGTTAQFLAFGRAVAAHTMEPVQDVVKALTALKKAAGKLPADLDRCPEMVGCLIEAGEAIEKANALLATLRKNNSDN